MILIVCVSDNMGIAFNNRRQSRDAVLCEDVANMTAGVKLHIHLRSSILFDGCENAISSENYLDEAELGEYCFYEGYGDVPMDKVEKIVLYRWNRDYPADKFFKIPKGFKLSESSKFEGSSHPEIDREIWCHE